MTLQQISPHVYIYPTDPTRDRPNIGYVCGEDLAVLIDCGNSADHLESVLEAIEAAGLIKPQLALITHWHWDHTFGIQAFHDQGGISLAEAATNQTLNKMAEWSWTPQAMQDRLDQGIEAQFCHDYMLVEYDNPENIQVAPARISYQDRLDLSLGGVHLKIERKENPHTDDGVVIFVEEDQVLFVGDADSGNFYELDGGYRPEEFFAYIADIQNIPYQQYVHGHVPVLTSRQAVEDFWQAIETEEL
ncbi:hypothetical protein AWM75_03335 [Aerococcus urinaehominis]|uniref:Uncharacterized protein n=1 Tax=Aerococcus urinaehominis TaxID=128944 RepID=A0A0X8FKP6_9LACT|nr:MBL fold metallo-hydrolase [Aerococcus urinaehominis]AMB99092.1 hypothetical protein AWM75_03335 [Aerococcus urinaehominis]SDM03368.1 Glyoxylase, beta-lactamase superfamily II [Aerococcus urinaehominis]